MTVLEKRRRLTRENWLAKALDVLAEEGIGAVCIEPVAKALGVTKGSFYWHFQDRDELVERLLEYWETERTDRLVDLVAADSNDPSRQLLTLFELVTTRDETSTMLRCGPGLATIRVLPPISSESTRSGWTTCETCFRGWVFRGRRPTFGADGRTIT